MEIIRVSDLVKQSKCVTYKIRSLCNTLYQMTDFICKDYPAHHSWFYLKHLESTLSADGSRDIIFARDEQGRYLGTAFIKNDKAENEKKICTLFVSEQARGMGVGTALVEECIKALGTTKPMITLADYKLPMFKKIIKKYGWQQTQSIKGIYNGGTELVYNGILKGKK